MGGSDDDLELLLAFQNDDYVPESPPHSRSGKATTISTTALSSPLNNAASMALRETLEEVFGYDTDDDNLSKDKNVSMETFRSVVGASLRTDEPKTRDFPFNKQPLAQTANHGAEFEMHSGLRIRNRLVSSMSLTNRLSDLRFVRLQAIRSAMMGDNITGSWATIGVLVERGMPKTSSTGKTFAIWKLASLDTTTISLFLFGDAYTEHWKESAGSIVAAFNAKVRRDEKRKEFSLSIFSSDQLLKLGTSADYCICKGICKDGTPCSMVINRRHGEYCQYHTSAMRQKFKSKRGELSGGNLATGFCGSAKMGRPHCKGMSSESVIDFLHPEKRAKHKTVTDLKKVLSAADKVTTRHQSQGIRCLARLTDRNIENVNPEIGLKKSSKGRRHSQKRLSKDKKLDIFSSPKEQKKGCVSTTELIELDLEGADDTIMAQAMELFPKI